MGLVTGSLGRPIQGMSQQPNKTRIEGQCELSVNLVPDVVKGLTTRTGSVELASLPFQLNPKDFIFYYRRDDEEEYFIVVPFDKSIGIRAFSPDGTIHTINVDAKALDYLYAEGSAHVTRSLKVKTIGDTTFMVNNQVTVSASQDKSYPLNPIGGVYCQFIDYAQEHKLIVDGTVLATYKSMSGTDNTDPKQKESVRTSAVIKSFVDQINVGYSGPVKNTITVQAVKDVNGQLSNYKIQLPISPNVLLGAFNKTKDKVLQVGHLDGSVVYFPKTASDIEEGDEVEIQSFTIPASPPSNSTAYIAMSEEGSSVLYLVRKDGKDFTLETVDDADGKNLIAVKGVIEDISMLPPKAPSGFKVKIAPKGASDLEVYWLEAHQDVVKTRTVWKETIAPDVSLGMDNSTMPIVLVRESFISKVATFSLKFNDWGFRNIGDIRTNTDPSFIGGRIETVGVFQNRLFFTSGESLSMSRSSEFYEFFKTTTQTVLKTDPYDIYSDSDEVVTLKDYISFNGDLVFFSDKAQLSLSGETIVTPEDQAPLRKVTSFETQLEVKPVAAGENIFFAYDYGQYSGVREFFSDSMTDTKRARPVTDHVNKMLGGHLRGMKSSTAINKLVVQTMEFHKAYVYEWMWQGQEKVQAAWSEWRLHKDSQVMFFEFDQASLYMLINAKSALKIVKIDLGDPPDNAELGFSVRLDNRKLVRATRNGDHWILPSHLRGYDRNEISVIAASGFFPEYIGVELDFETAYDITFSDNFTMPVDVNEVEVLVGLRVETEYIPSNPFPKSYDGTPRTDLDRLQVGQMYINYESSGDCMVEVETNKGKTYSYQLSPRRIGDTGNIVGFEGIQEGFYTIPIRTRSDAFKLRIKSVSHVPLQLREIEYKGTYRPRGRNM